MAKARKRKPFNQRYPAVGDLPTPETAAKLKRCSLETMRSRGLIGMEEIRAAEEIERCWYGLCGGLFSKAQQLDPMRGSGRGMPAAIAEVYTEHYKPWADWAGEPERRPMLDVVISVVIDGQTVGDIDADRRWREGRAAGMLREGLARYARMAGWLRSAGQIGAEEYIEADRRGIVAAISRATVRRRAVSRVARV